MRGHGRELIRRCVIFAGASVVLYVSTAISQSPTYQQHNNVDGTLIISMDSKKSRLSYVGDVM
jgi:hypothetical protein